MIRKLQENIAVRMEAGLVSQECESRSPRMSVIEKIGFLQSADVAHSKGRITWGRDALRSAGRAVVASYLEPLIDTVLVEGMLARHQPKVLF